jgi:hypothetical protein
MYSSQDGHEECAHTLLEATAALRS